MACESASCPAPLAVAPVGPPLATAAPFLFVFLWSTGFIGAKYGLPHAGPFSFLFVRFLVAITLLGGLALLARAAWPRGLRQWLRIGIAGLLLHATYLGGVYFAIVQGLPVALVGVVVGLQPLLTAAGAALLLGERVGRLHWLGLVVGLAGTVLVVAARLHGGFGLLGLPAAFAALFGITAGTLYQKRFCPHFDYRSGAVVQLLPAAAVAGLALCWFEDYRVDWRGEFVFALGWLTLVLSFGAVSLLNYLIRSGSATHVASLFYMVPPCTALIAWLAFGETLDGIAVAGMVLAIAGVYLVRQPLAKG